jgi:hypothetical protein
MRPCKRGHTAERDPVTRKCPLCRAENQAKHRAEQAARPMSERAKRKAARDIERLREEAREWQATANK